MGDLAKVPHVLDSREVAEMVGKRHANLIREAELMGDEPEEVLRHVASRIKHRTKEAKQDER